MVPTNGARGWKGAKDCGQIEGTFHHGVAGQQRARNVVSGVGDEVDGGGGNHGGVWEEEARVRAFENEGSGDTKTFPFKIC